LLAQQIQLVSQAITRSSFAVLGFSEFCDLGRLRREKNYVIEEKVIVILNSNMNVQENEYIYKYVLGYLKHPNLLLSKTLTNL